MTISGADITAWLGTYLWPFFRIGALVGVAPLFGARTVPVRLRIGIALVLTAVIAPLLPSAPAIDPISALGVMVTVQQVLIGLAMGFSLLLVFGAFILGGQIFAMQMGLGFASMVDPQRGVQVPMVSQFYVLLVTLIFLALDGHLVVIQVLADSFRTMPVAPTGLDTTGLWTLVAWGGHMFSGAVLMALPAIATLMLVNLAFGVMMRAAPQLNIFAVGFPITMTAGFLVILVMLPGTPGKFTELLDAAFGLMRQLSTAGVGHG